MTTSKSIGVQNLEQPIINYSISSEVYLLTNRVATATVKTISKEISSEVKMTNLNFLHL